MLSVDMLTGCGQNMVKDDNLIGSSEVAEAGASEAVTPANISETESDKASEKSDVLSETVMNTDKSEETEKVMRLYVNDEELSVIWEDNDSVHALRNLVTHESLRIDMSMYGGFEQVGSIGQSLPRNDKQTTTETGDIVLYSGNQIVVFYGSNSWSYTRLGHIEDKTAEELTQLLGDGNVTLTIGLSE